MPLPSPLGAAGHLDGTQACSGSNGPFSTIGMFQAQTLNTVNQGAKKEGSESASVYLFTGEIQPGSLPLKPWLSSLLL